MATSTVIALWAILGPALAAGLGAAIRAYFGPGASIPTPVLNSLESIPAPTLSAVAAAHAHGQLLQGHSILAGLAQIAGAALGFGPSQPVPPSLPGGVPLPAAPAPVPAPAVKVAS